MYSFKTLILLLIATSVNCATTATTTLSTTIRPSTTTTIRSSTTSSTTTTTNSALPTTEREDTLYAPLADENNQDVSIIWDLDEFPKLLKTLLPLWHQSLKQSVENGSPVSEIFNEKDRLFYTSPAKAGTFASAAKFCRAAGSNMIEIRNNQDADDILKMMDQKKSQIKNRDIWLSKGNERPIRWRPEQAAVGSQESGSTLNQYL